MALCPNCLRCTHNEPLIHGVCKECYEIKKEYEEDYSTKEVVKLIVET